MSRYTGPKARLCRREGINLFDRPKYARILEKRGTRPGMHGDATKKASGYSIQMREKQRLRFMFGLTDRKLQRYVAAAVTKKGLTPDMLMRSLEMRLDNVLFRAGFALTRMQGRQMASHGHFLINGRRVDVPSYRVKTGDKLEVRPKLKNSKLFPGILEENKSFKPARWLSVAPKDLKIEIVGEPAHDDFEKIIDVQKIVEFYSR